MKFKANFENINGNKSAISQMEEHKRMHADRQKTNNFKG